MSIKAMLPDFMSWISGHGGNQHNGSYFLGLGSALKEFGLVTQELAWNICGVDRRNSYLQAELRNAPAAV